MWGRLWAWLSGDRSSDRVDELSEEIETIRDSVLTRDDWEGEHDSLDSRLSELESWRDEMERLARSNEKALSHLVDVVSHHMEDNRVDEIHRTQEKLHQELNEVSQRLEALRNRVDDRKGPNKADDEPSKRPSERPDGPDGRPSGVVETAEGVQVGKQLWQKTTPAQRNVVKAMYDLGYPVSYTEIANELDRSVSTVKNHVNNLKSLGFRFKEDVGYNNSKKYLLDDRVKSFLTLRLND